MSYWIDIVDEQGEICHSTEPHGCAGGTYASGDTALQLNVTYNYGGLVCGAMPPDGIRGLNGKLVAATLSDLTKAVYSLPEQAPDADYWAVTPGNARVALLDLCKLARLAPAGSRWRVS